MSRRKVDTRPYSILVFDGVKQTPSRAMLALHASCALWKPWSVFVSLVVMNSSSRGIPEPAMARPTASSLPPVEAVSIRR